LFIPRLVLESRHEATPANVFICHARDSRLDLVYQARPVT